MIYENEKELFVPQSLNILLYVCGNQCRLYVPTSVIPGVPALLCIVTLVIASRQLEIVFLPVLQLFEVIRSYHRKISSFLLQYLNSHGKLK